MDMTSLVLINLERVVVGRRFILSLHLPHTTVNYKQCLFIKIKEGRQSPCNGNALEGAGAGWLLPYRARILSVVNLFVAGLLCGWLKKFSSSAERCPNPALALIPVLTALILFWTAAAGALRKLLNTSSVAPLETAGVHSCTGVSVETYQIITI